NSIYQTVTSAVSPYIVRASSSSTIAATPAPPTPYGTSVTLTSTVVTGATGTVNFETSTNDVTFTSIAGCSAEVVSATYAATCTTIGLPTGTDYLEAVYSGNTTYAPSTSTPTVYVVNPASQALLTVTSTSGLVGTALTLVTSGGSGTGAVTFDVVNGTATGCAITSTSLKVTTAGTCIVTASKASDGNYLVSSSVATTVTFVNPIPRAIRVIGAPLVGKTTVIGIAGQYFYGQPSIITNVGGVTARVSKDTGSLLTVQVNVKSGVRQGIYVFALTFKNGQRTNVKYNLR
ncbi:MAG: Ig-like domain-containing protein, partial [Acidimicrobiales bacterium]